jgi:hypothetical protein
MTDTTVMGHTLATKQSIFSVLMNLIKGIREAIILFLLKVVNLTSVFNLSDN